MADPESARSCPYCAVVFSIDGVDAHNSLVTFESARARSFAAPDLDDSAEPATREPMFTLTSHYCPSCSGKIIWLNTVELTSHPTQNYLDSKVIETALLFPKAIRVSLPAGTPPNLAEEYRQATQVLGISPMACAALARRSLQNLIRTQEQITRPSLQAEIAALIALGKLPSYLAADLDAIRVIGNFAAHPLKDMTSGAIMEVEPGEAEWTLEVLHELLLFYFEGQPQSRARRSALNIKLQASGKKPL